MCDEKEWLPAEVAFERVPGLLDGDANSHYRSMKSARDGDFQAAHLDAAESVSHLLDSVFTREHRVRP